MTDHLQRASLLSDHRRFGVAERELDAALAVEPENPMAHALMAVCLAHRREFRDASDHLRTALNGGPDLASVHHCAAVVAFLDSRMADAVGAIGAALELDPISVQSWLLQTQIFVASGHVEASLDSSGRALELEPSSVHARILRAAAWCKLGDSNAASREIDEALVIDPENATARAMSGWLHLDGDKREQALEHFRESLRMDPLSTGAQKGFSRVMMESTLPYRLLLGPYLHLSQFFDRPVWLFIVTIVSYSIFKNDVGPMRAALLSPPAAFIVLLAILVSGVVVAEVLAIVTLRSVPRMGRVVLDSQRTQSNWIVGLLLIASACAAWAWIRGGQLSADLAVLSGLCIFPVNAMLRAKGRPQQRFTVVYSIVFVASGIAFVVWAAIQRNGAEPVDERTYSAALVISFLLPLAALLSARVSRGVSRSGCRGPTPRRQSPAHG